MDAKSIEKGLFDVSGMFKRKPVTEAEKRAEAKRAYAEKVRQEHQVSLPKKKPQTYQKDDNIAEEPSFVPTSVEDDWK